MLKFLVTLVLTYKPLQILHEDSWPETCGASERLLQENVHVKGNKVNYMTWAWTDPSTLTYKADPDAYMSTEIYFLGDYAWYTIRGITKDRKPCMDTVNMKKI